MQIYWIGLQTTNQQVVGIISKWNIQAVPSIAELRTLLSRGGEKCRHFLMELNEINEKKYLEIKALSERFDKKLKFIVFYQTLKPSHVISKMHGSEIVLIGPEERNIADILLKRFFLNPEPLFRRWERFQVVTNGTLSLLSSSQVQLKTAIVNFGAHGTRIEFTGDLFKKKDFVVLEYLSHDGKKIRMQSRIVWAQMKAGVWQAGVQFISREI